MRDFTKTYRPHAWDEIVGQPHLVKTLKNEIANDTIGHAYLFCGPRGTGKTTTSRVFANNIDAVIIELDGASNNGVEHVRRLREDVQYLPTDGKKYKIYLIDEVHMLTTGAQNAFLKVLEEPPSHVIFILATTDPQKLLETIRSRCQRFDLRRIIQDDIIKQLAYIAEREQISIEYDALSYIAKSVDGGMRDAIKLLQKCSSLDENVCIQTVVDALGSVNIEHLENMSNFLLQKDIKEALRYFLNMVANGVDIKIFLADLVQYLTDNMADAIISNNYNIADMMCIADEIVDLLSSVRNNTQVKTLTELRFIKICKSTLISGVTSERVQSNEKNVAAEPKPEVRVDEGLEKRILDKLTAMEKRMVGHEFELDALKARR